MGHLSEIAVEGKIRHAIELCLGLGLSDISVVQVNAAKMDVHLSITTESIVPNTISQQPTAEHRLSRPCSPLHQFS